MNAISHRDQHHFAAALLEGQTWGDLQRRPAGEEYRAVRRAVAVRRRTEQRRHRIVTGGDRATIRALRRTASP